MKRQGGFTLIELVVVIVILGILAVTAAPRFLNLQDDAKRASAEGLKGAMAGAAGITYGKAAIAGQEGTEGPNAISVGQSTINVVWGYPEGTSAALTAIISGLTDDWTEVTGQSAGTVAYGFANDAATCHVTYQQAQSEGDEPSIDLVACE
ncbi:type II secretion system protein [Vibrio sp. 10N.222.51.C5]|uniref:type II secretion system protein n=1 Tax=Vibrio sp. 10N.222.51.C5 TaxID=3229623 RepID=UPI003553840F